MTPLPFPEWTLYIAACLWGACLGSFFNVIIHRFPRGESIVSPGSHCPLCGTPVKPRDNIPILSYIILRGKCRSCSAGISPVYPMVEAAAGAASAAALWTGIRTAGGDSMAAAAFYFFAMGSIPVIIIDIRHYLIPDLVTITGFLAGLALSFFPGGITPLQSLTGAAGAGFLLWGFGFITGKALRKEALGLGDVKLIAAAGALFGFTDAVTGVILGSFLGLLAALIMFSLKKMNRQRLLPFGPFLCLGVLAAAAAGDQLWDWYFRLIGM